MKLIHGMIDKGWKDIQTNHDKKRLERFGEVWIAIETYGLVFLAIVEAILAIS